MAGSSDEPPTVSLVDVRGRSKSLPPDIITMELELTGAEARAATELGPDTVDGTEPSRDDGPPRRVRRRLGRFSVLGTLGRGGMGTVLEAYDDTLARTVALKLLHGRVVEARQERLLREAQAMAQLSHPNVVQVYEVGMVEDQMFIAMELVEGQNMRQWQEQPRPWRAVIDAYVQAGRGLQAAHAEGLVHRDFKPENCIMGVNGRVCVLDFGLARGLRTLDEPTLPGSVSASLDEVSLMQRLTQSGKVLGTLCYLPLQQLMGRPSDEKSDQYSFCVSLYEALHGVLPFTDRSVEALIDAQRAQRFQPVPRGRAVPRRLQRILRRGLARNPVDRWSSMRELLEALERLRAPRRWPAAAAGATLLLGFGAGAFAFSTGDDPCASVDAELTAVWGSTEREAVRAAFHDSGHPEASRLLLRVEDQLDHYARRWVARAETACRAELVPSRSAPLDDGSLACLRRHRGRLRATVHALAEVSTPAEALERTVLPFKLPVLDACRQPASLEAPDLSLAVAQREQMVLIRRQLDEASTLGEAGALATATALAAGAVEQARQLDHGPLLAEALEILGRLQALGPDAREAEATLEEAIGVAAAAHDDASGARAWTSLIHARVALEEFERAQSLRLAASAAVERADDPIAQARLLRELGILHRELGEHRRACDLLERALRLEQIALGPTHIDVGVAWFELGRALQGDGRLVAARDALERARAILVGTVGASHPHVAAVEAGLGQLLRREGRLDDAADALRRALEIHEEVLGPRDPRVARSLLELGEVEFEREKLPHAAHALGRALQIFEATTGTDSRPVGPCVLRLAEVEWARGNRRRAEELAERAVVRLDTDGRLQLRAWAHFVLARALYRHADARARARQLAEDAGRVLDGERAEEVARWLDEHQPAAEVGEGEGEFEGEGEGEFEGPDVVEGEGDDPPAWLLGEQPPGSLP